MSEIDIKHIDGLTENVQIDCSTTNIGVENEQLKSMIISLETQIQNLSGQLSNIQQLVAMEKEVFI